MWGLSGIFSRNTGPKNHPPSQGLTLDTRKMGADESKPETVILLFGKTGDGKSSTGNTILGKPIFKSASSPNSETENSTYGDKRVDGRIIKVIDTPGIFGTRNNDKNIKENLIRSLVECAPGPHILTIVLKVGRYTLQEEEIEEKIWEYFKEANFKHSVVLFTHGEDLEGQTIEEFVMKSPKLQELVDKCEGRCHVIDNKHWNRRLWGYRSNRVQVKKLLETIKQKSESGYTNELLQIVEEEIREEIENIKENLSPEEKRARAKENVFKRLIIRLAGVTAGILTGALLGLTVPVASVVALLKGTFKSATATDAEADKTVETEAEVVEVGEAELETSSLCPLISEMEAEIAVETDAAAVAAVGATASLSAVAATAAAVEAGVAMGAAAAVGAATVEAGVATGAADVGAATVGTASPSAVVATAGAAVAATAGAAAVGTASVSAVAAILEAGVAGATAAAVDASITAGAVAGAAAVEAGVATGAEAAVGAAAVEAGVAAGATAAAEAGVAAGATAAGTVAAEAGVAAGAGIGAAAGTGIAVGVILGVSALAGAVGGGITGYKSTEEADSVLDAIKMAAKANYKNVKGVVEKAEQFPSNVRKKFQK